MLQITVTVSASQEKVLDEARQLERAGLVELHENLPSLVLNLVGRANEKRVIGTLAKLSRLGLVTDFRSRWIKLGGC